MNIEATCPHCDTDNTIDNVEEVILNAARKRVREYERREAEAAKELDAARASVDAARRYLAAIEALAATKMTS